MPTELEKKEEVAKHNTTVDPFVANLAAAMGASIDNLIDPDLKPKGDESAANPDAAKKSEETPEQKEARAEREAADKLAADKLAADEAAKKTAQQPVADTRPIILKKKEDKPAEPIEKEDEEYLKKLTDEQRDELELAAFAETKGKTGLRKQLIDFYKKMDEFVAENPDEEMDGEAFQKFRKENEPKLTKSERRSLEREMIIEQATTKAREEVAKEFEPVVTELNQMKSAPVLKRVADDVQASLTLKIEGVSEAMEADVVKEIAAMPRAQAVEKFPIEAPIVFGATRAAQELTRIWRGERQVDMQDGTHAWLMDFIANEEAKVLALPKEKQIRDGRQFVRLAEFARIQKTNPSAIGSYYTFDDTDIKQRIGEFSVRQYNKELKKLEQGGFTRVKPTKKPEGSEVVATKTATTTNDDGSPRATSRTIVGAAGPAAAAADADLPPHLRAVRASMGV